MSQMPGTSIEDRITAAGVVIPPDGQASTSGAAGDPGPSPAAAGPGILERLVAFLGRRSPKASIESYRDHALNWRQDPEGRAGAGQMIRAAEGWAGDLNLCIVDLVMGYLKLRAADRRLRGAPSSGQA